MFCYNCGNTNTKVIDSRSSDDNKVIRRRRECEVCNNRFTTFEKIETINLIVLKTGDRRERYNKNKLEDSIIKATNKRNISIKIINILMLNLELKWANKNEITSKEIGNDLLIGLKRIDEVAYIRFASVFLKFTNSSDFIKFISK